MIRSYEGKKGHRLSSARGHFENGMATTVKRFLQLAHVLILLRVDAGVWKVDAEFFNVDAHFADDLLGAAAGNGKKLRGMLTG